VTFINTTGRNASISKIIIIVIIIIIITIIIINK